MIEQSISVRHNVEMAHRLFLTPGNCEQIHGHSWDVKLTLTGLVDNNGLLSGINFTELKKTLREYLDKTFDHRVLLNPADPLAGKLHVADSEGWFTLPGLQTMPSGDPTTENFAETIGRYIQTNLYGEFSAICVNVMETSVNFAEWHWAR